METGAVSSGVKTSPGPSLRDRVAVNIISGLVPRGGFQAGLGLGVQAALGTETKVLFPRKGSNALERHAHEIRTKGHLGVEENLASWTRGTYAWGPARRAAGAGSGRWGVGA